MIFRICVNGLLGIDDPFRQTGFQAPEIHQLVQALGVLRHSLHQADAGSGGQQSLQGLDDLCFCGQATQGIAPDDCVETDALVALCNQFRKMDQGTLEDDGAFDLGQVGGHFLQANGRGFFRGQGPDSAFGDAAQRFPG